MKKAYFLILLIFCISLSCEKDDICTEDTVTTPQLKLEFFDIETIEDQNPKNVFRFRAVGVGNGGPVVLLDGSSLDGTKSVQKTLLPLKTTTEDPNGQAFTTEYMLTRNYSIDANGIESGNTDMITISYTTSQVYVSRGCGFKTVFGNISITLEDDGDNWIQVIQSVDDNQIIVDESETNFNIYH